MKCNETIDLIQNFYTKKILNSRIKTKSKNSNFDERTALKEIIKDILILNEKTIEINRINKLKGYMELPLIKIPEIFYR